MPQVTVYIREDDIDAWKSVVKKSEFIHNALEMRDAYKSLNPVEKVELKKKLTDIAVGATGFVQTADLAPQPSATLTTTTFKRGTNLCKIHGLPLTATGKCLQKGCKYT